MQDIKIKFLEFLEDKSKINDPDVWNAPLRDIIDSVGMIEMLAYIEKTFDIIIEDDEVTPETFQSLKTTVEFIEAKTS